MYVDDFISHKSTVVGIDGIKSSKKCLIVQWIEMRQKKSFPSEVLKKIM